jgi:hypothetical protein
MEDPKSPSDGRATFQGLDQWLDRLEPDPLQPPGRHDRIQARIFEEPHQQGIGRIDRAPGAQDTLVGPPEEYTARHFVGPNNVIGFYEVTDGHRLPMAVSGVETERASRVIAPGGTVHGTEPERRAHERIDAVAVGQDGKEPCPARYGFADEHRIGIRPQHAHG